MDDEDDDEDDDDGSCGAAFAFNIEKKETKLVRKLN